MNSRRRIPDSLSTPLRMARKPPHIPTTWGSQECFLDMMDPYDDRCAYLMQTFGRTAEYGLLNRLDTETSGLVYFASNPATAIAYQQQQSQHLITKYYIADVVGKVQCAFGTISTPIEHHPDDPQRMRTTTQRGQLCTTSYEILMYDPVLNRTTLSLSISKGVRHQIRVHLLSLGHPIIGDRLYINKSLRTYYHKHHLLYDDDILHLRSVGIQCSLPVITDGLQRQEHHGL